MRALNERLQKMQDEQAARQEALQNGRIRVERPEQESGTTEDDKEKKQKTSA